MKPIRVLTVLMALALVAFMFDACKPADKKKNGMKPPFGGQEDVSRAADLWKAMKEYRSWKSYPGLEGWQDGMSPHGKFLKYYINDIAAGNPGSPADGYVIVKENYGAKDEAKFGAITVMKKIKGYDPDNADWFWVKYDPKGNVMKNPKGMFLAGRVAKGKSMGCIACHSNADGNDLLFIND